MILLIDHYDSFSFNLYQLVGSLSSDIKVIRSDELTVKEIENLNPSHIILSPGTGRPENAGVYEEVIEKLRGKIPILGVCLGHQAIGEVYGAKVISAREILHGKSSDIEIIKETPLFEGLGKFFEGARYHSLAIDPETIAGDLTVTAVSDDGEVMAVEDSKRKVYGVQFHPESILTPKGGTILSNFLQQ